MHPGPAPRRALRVWRLALLLLLAACGTATAQTSEDGEFVPPAWYMVIDRAGILDKGQERSAINDAWRLNFEGIPTQVITENAALNQDQAAARADELRISHGIESSPGADDGLLLYASVNPFDRDSIAMSISSGSRTLPLNGLDPVSLQGVRETVMASQMAAGHPARAIVYSLREIAYLEQYVPPAVAPVTGWKTTAHDVLQFIGPLVAMSAFAWLWWSQAQGRTSGTPLNGALAIVGTAAITLALLAVPSQSTIGVFSALALGILVTWRAIILDRTTTRPATRPVSVTPRPPGSRLRPSRLSRTSPR